MLIANKEIVLNSFKRCAEGNLLDKDLLLAKLQIMVLNEDCTVEEVQEVVDILVPPTQ